MPDQDNYYHCPHCSHFSVESQADLDRHIARKHPDQAKNSNKSKKDND